jgi:hypothetical protein
MTATAARTAVATLIAAEGGPHTVTVDDRRAALRYIAGHVGDYLGRVNDLVRALVGAPLTTYQASWWDAMVTTDDWSPDELTVRHALQVLVPEELPLIDCDLFAIDRPGSLVEDCQITGRVVDRAGGSTVRNVVAHGGPVTWL